MVVVEGSMKIRHATLADIEVLDKNDKHISKQELENLIRLERVYIAEEDNKFIGWLRYNLFWDNTPFMNMLYLLEDSREKGYGRQLVAYWEKEMQQLGYTVVMTSTASDEYAQHFYHKLGYKTIGGFTLGDDPYEVILSKRIQ